MDLQARGIREPLDVPERKPTIEIATAPPGVEQDMMEEAAPLLYRLRKVLLLLAGQPAQLGRDGDALPAPGPDEEALDPAPA